MNDQTIRLLESLSSKLGTTAEHLWAILLAQAHANVYIYPIQIAVYAVVIFIYWKYSVWASKKLDKSDTGEVHIIVGLIIGGIISFILAIVIFVKIQSVATCILNPEYWALNRILEAISSSR